MSDNKYLLAFIVIDSMDHTSPYHGCSKKVYLRNLDIYKMTNEYELVECPGDSCITTLATNDGKGPAVTAVATMKTSKPMFGWTELDVRHLHKVPEQMKHLLELG